MRLALKIRRLCFPLLSAALLLPVQAVADAAAPVSGKIAIQLNTAETLDSTCRVTFVIQNRGDEPVGKLGLDIVMFDPSEGVSGYAAVDFGSMPAGKTVVRQYDIGNGACTTIARILLNDVRTCEIAGAEQSGCLSRLEISSRSEIDFIL